MPTPAAGELKITRSVDENLVAALDELTNSRVVVGVIFLLVAFPGVINMFHILLYVFIAPDEPYWCAIPALKDAGWTDEQIRNISSPSDAPRGSSCKYYKNDYEKLAKSDFEEASKISNKTEKLNCKKYDFKDKNSLVREWNLVCDLMALKTTVEMSLSLGKAIGATIFGWVADRWGRKRSLTLSALILIVSAHIASFSPYLPLFITMRFFVGLGGVGCYNCGFVLLTEICHQKDRQLLGILFNLSYGIGMLLLSLIAYYIRDWRQLHFYLSLPTLLLLIQIWLLPESGKWLMNQGRDKDAWAVVRRGNQIKRVFCQPPTPILAQNIERKEMEPGTSAPEPASVVAAPRKTCCARALGEFYPMLVNAQLRLRLVIELFLWTTTNLTYYTLSLNCDNFGSNRYIFMALAGVTEVVGYLLPVPLLRIMGRSMLELLLFTVTSVCLLVILVVPYEQTTIILVVAMVARLCVTAAFAVIILHTSELFPVEIRNTAFGLISTSSSVGAMGAPLLVSLLGAIDHKLPSTVCGASMIAAALVSRVLPETKNTELAYTIEEEVSRRKVSFENCTKLRI